VAYTFKHGDRPIEGLTIQRAVGRGGFGEVYYALSDSGKQVAVKYLRDNPDIELRGIAHVMNLKSPHLITIYDVRHSEQGDPFVIMEYVSGPSLRELLIAEPNGLGPQKAAFFVKGIASGLSYLHERGIVHRDLKPGNIFYDDGYIKIGDYGLSKHIAVSAHSGNTISVGTVHYMAPEIGSGSYTKSIDIYALGVMLYEMLTGRLPFTGSSMGEVLMRHLSDEPNLSGLPEPFAGVIAKALAKDPRDRYQDTDEMVEALTSVSEVNESLASFDASVLAQTRRLDDLVDEDRTQTTPPRFPVPVMDAREEIDLPPIPAIPPLLGPRAAKRARKLQERARKLQFKAEKKARAMHAKLADMGLGPAPRGRAEVARPGERKRWQQVVIALIVLFAVSGGLAIVYQDGVIFGASLLFLFLGTLGILLAYKLSVRRNLIEYDFQDRLLYAACGFVFMLPGFAAGHAVWKHGEQFAYLIIPLTVLLLLFNWNERIQMGRRQIISGSMVFWHAVVAAVIAPMARAEDYALVSAILAATLLILVQSVAGLWPLPTPAASRMPVAPPRTARHRRVWHRLEGAYQRVASAVEGVGERLEKTSEPREKAAEQGEASVKLDEASEAPSVKPDVATQAQPAPQPALAQGYQPSFVGRTANAGLSFLAKLVLLAGLMVAVLFANQLIDITADGAQFLVSQGHLQVIEGGRKTVDVTIPRAGVLLPLVVGTVLLVVARRNDGAAHFLRGFFGCAFAFGAAVLAMGPASGALGEFLSQGQVADAADANALIVSGVALALSFLLLFWPRRRYPGTIVV
jgi:hypothetical protein